ncbi:MAG: hypothetical protein ACE5G2_07515 [Candidatus Krumholzibacteriia bacterium]
MPQRRTDGGIRVFEDHRDNLTVDVQSDLVQERAAQMRSEDSQVAMLWNVFRSLQKLDPRVWLPRLIVHALREEAGSPRMRSLVSSRNLADTTFHWWQRYDLPPGRHEWLLDQARNANLHLEHYPARYLPEKKAEVRRRLETELHLEDPVEVPLCIETPDWLLGILTVYKGNLRQHTCYDARRDDVLRLLDAGSFAAAAQGKRFLSLVVFTDARTYNTETRRLVDLYRGRGDLLATRLPHRSDLEVVKDAAVLLGALRWRDVGSLLLDAKDEERIGLFDMAVLDELIKYLARKDVGFNFFRRLK